MPVTKEWIWNNDTGNDWGTRRRTCPRIRWSTTNRTCNDLESNPCLRNTKWVTWFSKHVSKGNCCGLLVVAFKKANCLSLRGADRPKISCIATGKLPQLLKSTGVPGNMLVITPVWQYMLFVHSSITSGGFSCKNSPASPHLIRIHLSRATSFDDTIQQDGQCTRWFKYDQDDLCVNKSQFVPVIFEPPCTHNVTLKRVRKSMSQCKSNKYYIFVSVCASVRARARACACMCVM